MTVYPIDFKEEEFAPMLFRAALILFAVLVAGVFGQGPVPVKAGDPAPHVIWNRVLQQPAGSTDAPGLFGRVSVICFLPNLSANASFIAHWNELARRFADKPVNFLLIASESGPALEGWLREHPVGGWLLLDPDSETAHAYGAETVGAAIVDFNGKIAGFAFMVPDERQIRAVLEGRAIAVEGDPSRSALRDPRRSRIFRHPTRFTLHPQRRTEPRATRDRTTGFAGASV
jgi:hypothetical protein